MEPWGKMAVARDNYKHCPCLRIGPVPARLGADLARVDMTKWVAAAPPLLLVAAF